MRRSRRGSAVVVALLATALLSLLGLSYLLTSNLRRHADGPPPRERLVATLESAVASARAELAVPGAAPRLLRAGEWRTVRDHEGGARVDVTTTATAVMARPPRGWDLGSANQGGFGSAVFSVRARASFARGPGEEVRFEIRLPALAAELGEVVVSAGADALADSVREP